MERNGGFSLNTNRNPIAENDLPDAFKLLTTARLPDYASQLATVNCRLQHQLIPREDFAKLDAYKASSAAFDFCRKFRTRGDRVEKALAEAHAAKNIEDAAKAEKSLASIRKEFSTATGLGALPDKLEELKTRFDATLKEPAIAFGVDPKADVSLTVSIKEHLDNQRDYSLNPDRHSEREPTGVSSYPMERIGDLCECINGRAFKPSDWETENKGGLPIVRIQNLNGTADFNFYSGEVAERYIIHNGDLLFSWSGSRGTSFGPHIWRGGKAILNQHIFRLVHNSRIDRAYFYYALKVVTAKVEKNLHGGVGLVHITKGNFEALEVPVPPLEEQRAIAAELASYQRVVDGCQTVLDGYKPSLRVDQDWPEMELGEIARNLDGKRIPITKGVRKSGPYPYYGASGIVDYVDDFIFDGDYLLVSEDGANLITRSSPIAFAVSGKVWVNNHAHVIQLDNQDLSRFVEHYLNQIDISKFVTGAAQPKLTQANLNCIRIPVPPPDVCCAVISEIQKEQATLASVAELKAKFESRITARLAAVWGAAPVPAVEAAAQESEPVNA